MNDILFAMMNAVNRGDPIEDLLPYDLSGLCGDDKRHILSMYILYGQDPERVKLCSKILKAGVQHVSG